MNPRIVCAALVAALALGCGKDVTEPTPAEIVAVVVSPVLDTLVSLNQTVQLGASAKDATGASVSATFEWTSENPDVATVDDQGLVTAVKNGTAAIRATARGIMGGAAMVVQQRPATVQAASGDNQGGTVGLPLDSLNTVTVLDALGSPVPGALVSFLPTGGTAVPPQASADAAGQAGTTWTLGVAAGTQEMQAALAVNASASVTFTATAFAEEPDSMYLFSGDAQFELASLPLPGPLQVRVLDRYGNGVPDVPITFSVSDGSLDETEVFTDLSGVATVHWTLPASVGDLTAQALLPDSAVGDIVNLKGSPVGFSAGVVSFAFNDVAPTPPVVGATMTLHGMGFDPDPSANTVSVGGLPATVTGGTQTSLEVTVPSFGCTPAQDREIRLTRAASTLSTTATIQPASALALNVGGTVIVTDAGDYCLQFLAAGGGTDEYLVGLTSTRRLNGELGFTMTADDGVNPPPAPLVQAARPAAAAGAGPIRDRELALRSWEEDFFRERRPRPAAVSAMAALAPPAPVSVGDPISIKVPNINTDPCNDYTVVNATVLAEGSRATIATDATLPSDPASVAAIAAAINTFTTLFGGTIYNVATAYFGLPTDVDQNGRIVLLFSNAITALGVQSFTTTVDLIDPVACPASNGGEVVYIAIPSAPSAATVAALLQAAPPSVAHDLTHVIQLSRRVGAGGVPMATWLEEGQAELGTEVVGMALRGDALRMDYGAAVVASGPEATLFYRPRFDRLSLLFGWDGSSGSVPGAPERCSLFGFGGLSVPCSAPYAAGAAWSFMRYVSDRIGASYAGGDTGWQRDLIGLDPATDGTALLETLAGEDVATLMVKWAMALYADGRISAAAAPDLQVPSWNLADVFGQLPATQRLSPVDQGFASFSRLGTVVGGGTAYTRVSAGGAHGALAVWVGDAAGNPLGDALRPRLWVVRVK